jgi:hypothetical protein
MEGENNRSTGYAVCHIRGARLSKEVIAEIIKGPAQIERTGKRTPAGAVKLNKCSLAGSRLPLARSRQDRAYEFGQLAKNEYGISFSSVDYPAET